MAEKELNPEEQKLQVRRRLMKMAIYSIPAIATVLATGEDAYSEGDDDDDWGSGSGSGSGGGGGKVPKRSLEKTRRPRKTKNMVFHESYFYLIVEDFILFMRVLGCHNLFPLGRTIPLGRG